MRYLRIFIYTVASLFILVVITGFITAYFYENEVKEYFKDKLNQQLNTKIIIAPENIHFSVLKNFPLASIEFNDIVAMDALPEAKDTLFKAENISLQFNLFDIYKKNYKIKRLVVEDGDLSIRIDKKGKDNYHFWKTTSDSVSSDKVSFALEKLVFKKMNFLYKDKKSKLYQSYFVSSAQLSGQFSSDNYIMSANSDIRVNYIKNDTSSYLVDKKVELTFKVDVEDDNYTIHSADVKIADLKLQLSGKVKELPNAFEVNVNADGKDMDIQSIFSLLPEKYKDQLADYESAGDFYFKVNIKGTISDEEIPKLTATFGINNGEVTQKSSSITLKKLTLEGEYENKPYGKNQEQTIDIKKLSTQIGNGRVEGSLKISDVGIPSIDAVLRAETDLNDVKEFLKLDTIESAYGNLRINAKYKGLYKPGKEYTAADYRNAEISGDIVMIDAGCRIKNSTMSLDSVSGTFVINNSDFVLNNIKGRALNSDFAFDGTLKNIVPFMLIDDEPLWVNANFNSNNLDLNSLLENKNESSSEEYSVKLSERINADLNTKVGRLVFNKFEAKDISGRIFVKNKKLVADPLSFKAVDGEIEISGMMDATQDGSLLITCDASLKKLNINKLFYQCENFGQDVMVDDNLKGFITSDIKFASVWSSALDVDLDKVYAYADVVIEKGELIKFEPMKELSRFVKLSELENIKFSTLKNTIEIKKQKIYIPRMEVVSSAMNITCSGTHSFNNEIDYHIKVMLNELLSKKAKSAKKENDEFGVVEDDGLGRARMALFVSMTGTVDDPVIKYDRKGAKEKLKEDIKVEKQTLKSILRDEFGWFKKDSTGKDQKKAPVNKKDDDKFIIKWNEDDDQKKKQEDDDF